MIYLLKSGNYLKVGSSADAASFKKRLDGYKTHNPIGYEIIDLFEEGDMELEHSIQYDLIDYHHTGEWFKDCKEVRDIWNKRTANLTPINKEPYIYKPSKLYGYRKLVEKIYNPFNNQTVKDAVRNTFEEGIMYSRKEMKAILRDVYEAYNVVMAPCAEHLREYGYRFKKKYIAENGKIAQYIILYSK